MALTVPKIEKAARRLLALEQRIDRARLAIEVLKAGGFSVGKDTVPLSQAQKSAMTSKISQGVVALENVLAGLETEVTGSTAITPGSPGAGISDWDSALIALEALRTTEAKSDLREVLVQAISQNMTMPRGEDGEIEADALTADSVKQVKDAFKERISRVKLAVSQLRALGA